jgi:hypothetical protein
MTVKDPDAPGRRTAGGRSKLTDHVKLDIQMEEKYVEVAFRTDTVEGVDAPLIAFPLFAISVRTLRYIGLRIAYLFCTYIGPNITFLIPNYEHLSDQ